MAIRIHDRAAAFGVAILAGTWIASVAPADTAPQDTAAAEAAVRWPPPGAEGDSKDWIRTTSGEWLRGELVRMRDDKITFDSEEFDDLEVDLEDIDYFRLTTDHSYRFRGREVFRGSGELRNGGVAIRTLQGDVVERDVGMLVAIAKGAGNERDYWSVDAGLGVTARQGNSKQSDLSGRVDIQRETPLSRLSVEYDGAFARVDGATTANSHRLQTALDLFLTWRLYLTLPFFEYFADEFQNIDARITPGVGMGYEIIDSPRIDWDVTWGLAYQHTDFDSATRSASDVAVVLGTEIEIEVTDDLDFETAYRLQLIATDLDRSNHHLSSVLSFDVWGPLDLDVTFIWDRIENPETTSSGAVPRSNDYRLTIGLAIDL